MHWDEDQLLSVAAASIAKAALVSDESQEIRGIDSLDELEFHPLLARAFADAGLGVHREFPLPGPVGRRSKKTERARCDLVLTHDPVRVPADPMAVIFESDERLQTLFAQSPMVQPRLATTPLEECYFLEVKSVGQWVYIDGVPGPNRTYSSSLTGAIARDLKKLAADDRVTAGGVLLILFTQEREVADHDLPIALHRTLDRNILFRSPRMVGLPVANRIGNAWCTLMLVGKLTP